MLITAIIVTHNSADVIESALACVCHHPRITDCIAVDNASKDATLAIIRLKFPHVKIITNDHNLGFGAACNQALEKVTSEFALFLNPDATIDSKGINVLVDNFLLYPNAAIIAPVLKEHRLNSGTFSFRQPALYGKKPAHLKQPDDKKVFSVAFVSGAVAMWRMEYMKRVGFFDPAFFLFYEDDDLSIRVLKTGYDLLLISGIDAWHTAGTSCTSTEELTSLKLRCTTWSYLYIHNKYRGRIIAKIMAFCVIISAFCKKIILDISADKKETESSATPIADRDEKQAFVVKEHERKRLALVKMHEDVLAAEVRKQKGELATIIKNHEARWATSAKALERQWAESMRVLEEQGAALVKKLERRNRIAQRKKENADKLWAALYFIKNPVKFKK